MGKSIGVRFLTHSVCIYIYILLQNFAVPMSFTEVLPYSKSSLTAETPGAESAPARQNAITQMFISVHIK
jgi:hypothetical protein